MITLDYETSPVDRYREEIWLNEVELTETGELVLPEDYAAFTSIVATLVVSAASGTTPTMTMGIQDTTDGVTWDLVGSTFSAMTEAGFDVIRVSLTTPFTRRLKLGWEIGGTTPSFTATVTAVLQS